MGKQTVFLCDRPGCKVHVNDIVPPDSWYHVSTKITVPVEDDGISGQRYSDPKEQVWDICSERCLGLFARLRGQGEDGGGTVKRARRTPEQLQQIVNMVAEYGRAETAKKLGVTVQTVNGVTTAAKKQGIEAQRP